MGYGWLALAAVAALVALGWLVWRRGQAAPTVDRQRALQDFEANRELLAAEFFHAAATSGKPRGLRWKSCELSGPPLLAVDRKAGLLYALVAVTVSFEAIAGGAMEDVLAVGNLRAATAVFYRRNEHWSTDGRVVFNLEPHEAVRHFSGSLERVDS